MHKFSHTKVSIPDNNLVIPLMANTFNLHWFYFGIFEPSQHNLNNFHQIFELFHCIEGTGTVWLNEEPMSVCTGDWLLIKTGVRHRIQTSDSPYSFATIHFDIDDQELRKVLYMLPSIKISTNPAVPNQLSNAITEIDRMLQTCLSEGRTAPAMNLNLVFPTAVQKLLFYSSILNIIYQFISLQPSEQMKTEEGEFSPLETEMANRIAEIIEDSVYDTISIANIARKVGLSRSQCTRVFTNVYRVSPRQYTSHLKLNKAKELLNQTDLTVERISDQLGFSSVNHFSRQFRRWAGASPKHFRPSSIFDQDEL